MEYFLALTGFILLIFSGKYLVKGSVSLARYFGLSTLVIGVTVVAFGTSAPELIVSFQAAMKGHPEISLGNVIGSNISNIALILGLTAMILPIPVQRNSVRIDWPVMMITSLLFYVLVLNNELGRLEGLILNTALVGFVFFSLWSSRRFSKKSKEEILKPKLKLPLAILIIILSCGGLVFGADLLVDNAVIIAGRMGVSERAISISLIALGTSLPELATSVIAAFEKEMDISVGNIIGSNIFNILSVLGITALVKPIEVSEVMVDFDILWMLGISALLFPLMLFPLKAGKITRFEGLLLVVVYFIYIYLVFN